MSVFILDTNIFIQSHRINYPLDVAISYWQTIQLLANEHKIIIIDKVREEIFKNDDELTKWIKKKLKSDFFKSTNMEQVIDQYKRILRWAQTKSAHYVPNAINEFLQYENADAWIIAYALHINEGCQIVTQEKSEPNRKSKIKIPDVCKDFNISYKNIIEMFRELRVTF